MAMGNWSTRQSGDDKDFYNMCPDLIGCSGHVKN